MLADIVLTSAAMRITALDSGMLLEGFASGFGSQ